MIKRTILLGDYDTASNGWTLSAWELTEPEVVTNYVDVPGRVKGPLDLSTSLTDGLPVYSSRSLTVTLEISEGDRISRELKISDMINRLHGQRKSIVIPDHPNHYVTGRLSVARLYNDPAHGSVQVTGVCEPWLYAKDEKVVTLEAAEEEQSAILMNHGAMPIVPIMQVEGDNFHLTYNNASLVMSSGTYAWADLFLTPGEHVITYKGAGTLKITYSEAVLR